MRFSLFFCVMSLVAITLSGCLSLMNLSPEDRFIFSTPHPAEAEVYMRVIRDYSVGDWLHGIESDFHVNRIFWNARYGYLRVPKEDMRYAQRLIDAEILYKTSYLLWDCWPRNKEREKKLGSTFTSRFVGASPYPE
ncbi:MAG: hypothetical protein LBI31_06225, partial [Zoogloeaceae bacterium]|nr:hypothetical protein [Zoogloeaceae bacterium]